MRIAVLCPTRGRPDNAWEVVYSLEQTQRELGTSVLFIVDEDDPKLEEYQTQRADETLELLVAPRNLTRGMVGALNWGVTQVLNMDEPPRVLGFIGDDHRFRTKGWDAMMTTMARARGTVMMFGNDRHRHDIPTQIFMTSDIPRSLGYMALPDLHHLYVDNAWQALGEATDTLVYMPEVEIEHMHPFYGTAQMDEGYARVNDETMYSRDREAFARWRSSGRFREDCRKVEALR